MPRIPADQLASAIRAEGASVLPVSRVCDALARAGGLYDPAGTEVRRSVESRPDLFFLLEPGAVWDLGDAPEHAPGLDRRALGAAAGMTEAQVVLLPGGAGDRSPGDVSLPPPIHGLVLRLWEGARRDPAADAELAGTMRDAVELERLLAPGRGAVD